MATYRVEKELLPSLEDINAGKQYLPKHVGSGSTSHNLP